MSIQPTAVPRYVYNQVRSGQLVGTRLGRSVKISRQNLQSFLARCETSD